MDLDTKIMEYLHKNTDWSLGQIAIVGSQVNDDNAEWAYDLIMKIDLLKIDLSKINSNMLATIIRNKRLERVPQLTTEEIMETLKKAAMDSNQNLTEESNIRV